ncbi:MAG: DNA-directed RNA polymerase subunit B [Candidatus Diapherotrites archaeon]|uniref:DNA-directed RNA polymerase subunit beta n=1 Tax=Candidatus Iainarchaeum sp. TaxID=3101447 RepID=A0A2D6M0T1_9ARCH|nr:DNA-directed RNA polymerase subunit B [Candidatus Diapherotrites archaeon]|tara:strand:- start:10017 stop:11840 length:1824 start_codon:yes stop_codon:yes gene_type:complete
MATAGSSAKIYINGRLIGFHASPEKLTEELVKSRRSGKISSIANIAYHKDTNELYINTDSGRVQRPLIVVENGKSMITEEHLKQLTEGKLSFTDLVKEGLIEYLDSEEENNALIALDEKELGKAHTHLEINPIGILSVVSSMIPYLQHNMAGKALHGAKMFKQAIGICGINYNLRTDTEGYLLYYPQKTLVKSKTMDFIDINARPQVQNFVVAIMPYYGFNTLDALILNQGAVDRGLGRNTYFRMYEGREQRYPGGQADKFELPTEETVGYLGEEYYKKLGDDGLVQLEQFVNEKDIVIGRTSPPRFLEEISEFGVVKEKRRDSSVTTRKGKSGFVDKIVLTESADGNKLAKIKIRSTMLPEVGDKFSSRHGQKGVIGAIVPEADMPFTAEGIKPDLIINPHSIPSRMTIGHLLETLAGKAGCMNGNIIDGTPFNSTPQAELEEILKERGFDPSGKEVFYDGVSGEKIEGTIFTGVVAYRRLFHLVAHKMQARSRGPVQILTRQPTEGKEKEGGLRFGEMEGETLVGHGAAMLLHEKFIEDSDKVALPVCEKCGIVGWNDVVRKRKVCPVCDSSKVYDVEMSYGFKLLLDELKALGIMPKLSITDRA